MANEPKEPPAERRPVNFDKAREMARLKTVDGSDEQRLMLDAIDFMEIMYAAGVHPTTAFTEFKYIWLRTEKL